MPESDTPDPSPRSEPDVGAPDGAAPSATRREAVRRLGRYAAYTAPALMGLLAATTTASAS